MKLSVKILETFRNFQTPPGTLPKRAIGAMGGGRQPDMVWKYAEANPNKEEAVKKPYVDIFQKKAHSGAR